MQNLRLVHSPVTDIQRATMAGPYLERVWRQEGAYVCCNGTIQAADDNLIALMQDAIDKHDINGCSKTLNDLDLQHSALQLADEHQALRHHSLRKPRSFSTACSMAIGTEDHYNCMSACADNRRACLYYHHSG